MSTLRPRAYSFVPSVMPAPWTTLQTVVEKNDPVPNRPRPTETSGQGSATAAACDFYKDVEDQPAVVLGTTGTAIDLDKMVPAAPGMDDNEPQISIFMFLRIVSACV